MYTGHLYRESTEKVYLDVITEWECNLFFKYKSLKNKTSVESFVLLTQKKQNNLTLTQKIIKTHENRADF